MCRCVAIADLQSVKLTWLAETITGGVGAIVATGRFPHNQLYNLHYALPNFAIPYFVGVGDRFESCKVLPLYELRRIRQTQLGLYADVINDYKQIFMVYLKLLTSLSPPLRPIV